MAVPALLFLILIAQTQGWAGDRIIFPDPVVVNQSGQSFHFHTGLIKGKTAVIDFIFTLCTVVCRPLTANLRKVRAELDDETLKDIQFVLVSVDPTRDTPSALTAIAQTFRLPSDWSFIIGPKQNIDQILNAAGVHTIEPNYHTARVITGSDRAGWSRYYGLSSPAALAQALRRSVEKAKGIKP
jgi:cytochrome oxidase Cu insertion factor (SCO1/SenC/PrrC family)